MTARNARKRTFRAVRAGQTAHVTHVVSLETCIRACRRAHLDILKEQPMRIHKGDIVKICRTRESF